MAAFRKWRAHIQRFSNVSCGRPLRTTQRFKFQWLPKLPRRLQTLRQDVVLCCPSWCDPATTEQHEDYELQFNQDGVLANLPHAQGAREYLTVIDGQLTVSSGDAVEQLSMGDTARYAADVPHKISADGPARAFLVVHGA